MMIMSLYNDNKLQYDIRESDKNTTKHYKQEPNGQHFPSRGPQGRCESMTNTRHKYGTTNDPQKKYRLGTDSKKYLTGGHKPV